MSNILDSLFPQNQNTSSTPQQTQIGGLSTLNTPMQPPLNQAQSDSMGINGGGMVMPYEPGFQNPTPMPSPGLDSDFLNQIAPISVGVPGTPTYKIAGDGFQKPTPMPSPGLPFYGRVNPVSGIALPGFSGPTLEYPSSGISSPGMGGFQKPTPMPLPIGPQFDSVGNPVTPLPSPGMGGFQRPAPMPSPGFTPPGNGISVGVPGTPTYRFFPAGPIQDQQAGGFFKGPNDRRKFIDTPFGRIFPGGMSQPGFSSRQEGNQTSPQPMAPMQGPLGRMFRRR